MMEVVTEAVAMAIAADSKAAAVSCEACGHTLLRLAGADSSSES